MKKVVIAAILVAILIIGGTFGYFFFAGSGAKEQPRAEINPEKPTYDNVITKSIEDFGEGKDAEMKFAVYLYETANAAFQNCDSCAAIDYYTTTTSIAGLFSIPNQGCRFTVKQGTEYYYADYSGMPKNYEKFMSMVGKAEDTMFAKRSYTDIAEMDYLYTEKVLQPSVNIVDGNINVTADWSEKNGVSGYPKHEEVPVFCAGQEGVFEQTEQKISLETVQGAAVTYDEEERYYTVSFLLDVNNPETTAKTIGNLQAGLAGGYYKSISKVYQIWDNGYFRQAESLDFASNGAMELKLDFKTYFKYREEDCMPSAYPYFTEVREKALAELK